MGRIFATVEAMYFYTPVIVMPYHEFTATFGTRIGFGYYCEHNAPAGISEKIRTILNTASYSSMCMNAHDAVAAFAWNAYIDKVITKTEAIINPS